MGRRTVEVSLTLQAASQSDELTQPQFLPGGRRNEERQKLQCVVRFCFISLAAARRWCNHQGASVTTPAYGYTLADTCLSLPQ